MSRKREPTPATSSSASNSPDAPFWQRNRREVTFLGLFLLLLGGGFTLISLNWVNAHAIEPFTAGIARVSGAVLDLMGQNITQQGTILRGSRFAGDIRNE